MSRLSHSTNASLPALAGEADGPDRLPLYVDEAQLDGLRQQATDLKGTVALAWHLRERDSPEAGRLARQALQQLNSSALPEPLRPLRARTLVTLADLARAAGQLDEAHALADEAQALFDALGEPAGVVDSLLIRAQAHASGGQAQASADALRLGIDLAWEVGDCERIWGMELGFVHRLGLSDATAAAERWAAHLARVPGPPPEAVVPLVQLREAYQHLRASAFAEAIASFSQALPGLRRYGHWRSAILACINCSSCYVTLLDGDDAQQWLEQAMALARPTGSPTLLGACLLQAAEIWRLQADLPSAKLAITDALTLLTAKVSERNHFVALVEQGHIELEMGEPETALTRYEAVLASCLFADLKLQAQLGQGRALLGLGRVEQALASGQAALERAQARGATEAAVQALQLCAAASHRLDETSAEPGARRLALLQQADALAQSMPGYLGDARLLTDLAEAYAQRALFQEAYEASRRATQAHADRHQRDIALQRQAARARLQAEGARASAEMHRLQAAASQQRAELQAQANAKLERLGHIGQQLTQHLEHEAIFSSLAEHVPTLLDARGFEVYLLDAESKGLVSVFALEDGQVLPKEFIAWDDPQAYTARCARSRQELLLDLPEDGSDPSQVPGTLRTLSAMFGPMVVGDRLIGVLTVQSPHARAYGKPEQMVFRTLSAYAAIALDNASAYQRLREARRQLVSQERMAALGAMVAGVAHELNTPLGNSLLMASTLESRLQEVALGLESNRLRKSELTDFVSEGQAALKLLVRSLGTASQLIGDFKQVAVDRTAERRRRFDLAETCHQVLQTLQASVRKQGHHLSMEVPEGLMLDSYPGPLGQVLTNFVNNAMLHGFEGRSGGHMHLTARGLAGERVELRFTDDGRGVEPGHAARLFEPFFTTKFGQGGSGLGLSISHNIVGSIMGGELTFDPAHAPGACFVITLPLRAPAQPET